MNIAVGHLYSQLKTEGRALAIIGASGHGKVLADIAHKNGYQAVAFFDDNKEGSLAGHPILGPVEEGIRGWDSDVIVGIGNPDIRQDIQDQIAIEQIATLIHPNAVVAEDAHIEPGTVVMAGAVINPGVRIGRGSIVNTCASIDHDCNLDEYVHVAVGAHLCGTVRIGPKAWIGAGSVISNNTSICQKCMIGVGAAVIHDIEVPGTYVGVPARRIK